MALSTLTTPLTVKADPEAARAALRDPNVKAELRTRRPAVVTDVGYIPVAADLTQIGPTTVDLSVP